MIERHPITSQEEWLRLRRQDVTASVVGALFGVHPYQTPAGLWAEKTGVELPRRDTADMRRGRLLEGAIAEAVREERPKWTVTPARAYWRDGDTRLGATPDFFVRDTDRPAAGIGIMQGKTANQWEAERHWQDEPPFWIVLQALTEMMLLDAQWGVVALLIVDGRHFELRLFDVPRHPAAEARIVEAVREFWRNVEAGREPTIDYERDSRLIEWMHRAPPEQGRQVDLRGDNTIPELLDRHLSLVEWIKAAQKEQTTIDAEIKRKLGDAEIGIVNGYRVTWKLQHQEGYSVAARDQRVLRIKQIGA